MAVTVEQLYVGGSKGQYRQTLESIATPKGLEHADFGRPYYHERTPVVLTTRAWLSQGIYIKCWCNPSEANWTPNRRESMQKTAAGMVRNTWLNRYRGTYYDNFPISFTFQAGNILPSSPYNLGSPGFDLLQRLRLAAQAPLVPPGLQNFYSFLELTDQPALMGTVANYHIIVYHSRVFPQLWLEGWFQPEGLSWADSSQNGNTVTWQHTFLVNRIVPKLTSASLMLGLYSDWVKNSGALSEAIPPIAMQRQLAGLDVADIWANPYAGGDPWGRYGAGTPTTTPPTTKPGASTVGKSGSSSGPAKSGSQAVATTKSSSQSSVAPSLSETYNPDTYDWEYPA